MSSYHAMLAGGQKPVILDGGGNIGLAAVWFAEMFPEALIVTVEPEDRNFEILKKNIHPYGDRIRPVNGAVTASSGRFAIENPEAGPSSFRMREVAPDEPGAVQGFSVPELLDVAGFDQPLIVKLDIEGGQKSLFERDTEWVSRSHLIILELDDWLLPWSGTSRPFFKCLSDYPFDYLLAGENIFCFQDLNRG